MPKQPFLKFYPADWILDTRVLTDEEKAIWIDLLCFMWMKSEDRGILTGFWADISRTLGRERMSVQASVTRMSQLGVIEMDEDIKTGREPLVTLTSRRMVKDSKSLNDNNNRQKKHREKTALSNALSNASCNANVTGRSQKLEVRSQKTEEKEEKTKDTAKAVAANDAATPQAIFVLQFKELYQQMTGQPYNANPLHYKLAAALLKKHGPEAVILKVRTLGVLCRDRSAWFTGSGWADFSIEKLSNRWNEIIPDVVPISREEKEKQKSNAIREEVKAFNERTQRALEH